MPIEIIDTHCHLDSEPFDTDRQEVIERAHAAGVTRLITIGTGNGLSGAYRAIALAEAHPNIWATVGVHPHNAAISLDLEELDRLAQHQKVVAIGETGLDFFRDWAPVDAQHQTFQAQIALARKVKKPLVIHSRNAGAASLETLIQHQAHEVGGVFHCFSENAEFAARLREINFRVSFPGQLTFKKAHEIRAICKEIPLDQILVETDAPYLSPEPHRGKRCEPAFVVETTKMLAHIKGLSLEEVAAITTENSLKLFAQIVSTDTITK
jgi:TatD DNase family protein